MINKEDTKRLVLSGVFAAAIMILTMISVQLPSGLGYVHFGDSIIFLAVVVLGSMWHSAAAAAIGSAMADVLVGQALFAPMTLLVKGAVSCVYFVLLKKYGKAHELSCMFAASLLIPFGYFLYELALYGIAAYLNIWYNLLQAVAGVIVGELLTISLRRIKLINTK